MSFDSANALLLDINDYLNAAASNDKNSSTTTSSQWMENYGGHQTPFELFAPDPDLFDSELEASAADLNQLDIHFPAHDTIQPLPPAAYYGSYRTGPASAFNGTVSSVSESQSGYNDYDTASFYSGHDSGYNHHITANGSLYSTHATSAVGTVPQQQTQFHSPLSQSLHHTSSNSHYGGGPTGASDIDLDFAEFSLSSLPSALHALGTQTPQVLQLGNPAAPGASSSSSAGVNGAAASAPTSIPAAIDTATLNSVHLFMNQSVMPAYAAPQSLSSQSHSQTQSPIDFDAVAAAAAAAQSDMYFPRRGDPLVPGIAGASSSSSSAPGQRGAKREATSSPAIPTPDFGIEHQLRPGKRAAASASTSTLQDVDDMGTGSGAGKRYKCPSCERGMYSLFSLSITVIAFPSFTITSSSLTLSRSLY